MPKLIHLCNRDENGKFKSATVFASPVGVKHVDGRNEPATYRSELVLERDCHGIRIRTVQATNNGTPIAPDYWKPNEVLVEHPEGLRALRDMLTTLIDELDDERYENA